MAAGDHHVGGVGGSPGHQQRADHREGAESYEKRHVLYGVLVGQTGEALEHLARADARRVQDDDHPPRHAREQPRRVRRTIGGYAADHPFSLLYENPAPVAHGVMTTPFYAAIVSCSLRSVLRIGVPPSNANCFLLLSGPLRPAGLDIRRCRSVPLSRGALSRR
jgi:hypothetical protein